jgi:hypothetical protein
MFNAHSELNKFFNEKVKLSEQQRSEMRQKRDANRDRLDSGLEKKDFPKKIRNIIQGSYKMKTMIQRANNDFDIDDGVIFTKDSLQGTNGGDKSALDARKMVADALQDARFSQQPKYLKNCVRVFYNEGYHIDIPVYREYLKDKKTILELASTDWKASDPDQISDWFEQQVREKSPTTDNTQMRRIVCLLKKWAKSRSSWNLPNGLIFSVYAADYYYSCENRDDEAFVTVLNAIKSRLQRNKTVPNPIDTNEDFATGREHKIDNLRQKLDDHLPTLMDTLQNSNCTKNEAMRAWADFFNDDFFRQYIVEDDDNNGGSSILTSGIPPFAVQKHGQGRYA